MLNYSYSLKEPAHMNNWFESQTSLAALCFWFTIEKSFIWASDYTGCATCLWFSKSKRLLVVIHYVIGLHLSVSESMQIDFNTSWFACVYVLAVFCLFVRQTERNTHRRDCVWKVCIALWHKLSSCHIEWADGGGCYQHCGNICFWLTVPCWQRLTQPDKLLVAIKQRKRRKTKNLSS